MSLEAPDFTQKEEYIERIKAGHIHVLTRSHALLMCERAQP